MNNHNEDSLADRYFNIIQQMVKDEEYKVIYSCCGDKMTIDLIDYGICPTCKEHCM